MTTEQFNLITISDPTEGLLVKTSATIIGGGSATSGNQVLEIAELTAIDANQTNKTQFTKITDGADTMLVNADGSINVNSTFTPSGTQNVNITQLLTVAPSATNPFPARQTDGTAFLANLGETAATGNFAKITDGTDTLLVNADGSINTTLAASSLIIGNVRIDQTTPGTTNGVVVNSSALPTGASSEAKQDAEIVLIGAVTETAPASDTASSGLNGRLQRIAQRLTSLIALLPTSLGIKTAANSFPVTLPSDGTLPLPTGASTSALQTTGNTTLSSMNSKLALIQSSVDDTAVLLTKGTSGTDSSVAANVASTLLVAQYDGRKSATIRNDGTGILYVSKTNNATATTPIKLLQDDTVYIDDYTGQIFGIWVGVNGNARINEIS